MIPNAQWICIIPIVCLFAYKQILLNSYRDLKWKFIYIKSISFGRAKCSRALVRRVCGPNSDRPNSPMTDYFITQYFIHTAAAWIFAKSLLHSAPQNCQPAIFVNVLTIGLGFGWARCGNQQKHTLIPRFWFIACMKSVRSGPMHGARQQQTGASSEFRWSDKFSKPTNRA